MHTESTRRGGFTLLELTVVVAIVGLLVVASFEGFRSLTDSTAITGATRAVHQHVVRARSAAVYRRERVRLRLDGFSELTIRDGQDSVLHSLSLAKSGPFGIDSVRLRPATLRFNPRGQAAPGSIYLYRSKRGARVIVNFLGRVRVQRFPVP